jgi:hypothetical protein
MNPFRNVLVATVTGILLAFLWQFLNAEIVGYLALWRFSDHWTMWAHIALPALLFLGITTFSYWVLMLAFRAASAAAIWASFLGFTVLMVYAHAEVSTGRAALAFSGVLIGVAVLSGLVALKIVRRDGRP